jgi:hypothetical protein
MAIADNRAIDVCDICGVRVWGHKQFRAIISEAGCARERGDLEQGNVV